MGDREGEMRGHVFQIKDAQTHQEKEQRETRCSIHALCSKEQTKLSQEMQTALKASKQTKPHNSETNR